MRNDDAVLVAQAATLAGLLWPGRARWRLPRTVLAGAAAAVVAGGAVAVAGASAHGGRLTPRVEPPAGAPLVTDGVYALSRHPVYAGLLAAATGWAVLRRRPEPLVALAGLSAVLHVKSGMEERALRRRYGIRYDEYADRTPRLVGLPRP